MSAVISKKVVINSGNQKYYAKLTFIRWEFKYGKFFLKIKFFGMTLKTFLV